MTSIGMLRRRRTWFALGLITIIAVGVGAVVFIRAGAAYDIVERLPVRRGMNEARDVRFESAAQLLPAVRGPWIGLSDIIPVDAWPREVVTHYRSNLQARLLARTPPAALQSTRTLQFGGPRGRNVRSIKCGKRALLFHSALLKRKRTGPTGLGPTRRFFDLAVIEADDTTDLGRETPLLEIVEGPLTDSLPLAVAAIEDEMRLVYITNDSITEQRGHVTRSGLKLDKPTVLRPFEGRAGDLQMLATSDAYHMIWSEGPSYQSPRYHLYYQRADRDGHWDLPRVLSKTVNDGTASLLVDGEDVLVAWSDHRFKEWHLLGNHNNIHKIFVQRVSGHDRRSRRPVLLSDPNTRRLRVDRTFLAATPDELVIYWFDQTGDGSWSRAAVDRALTTITLLEPMPGPRLMEDYAARLRSLDGVGRPRQTAIVPFMGD